MVECGTSLRNRGYYPNPMQYGTIRDRQNLRLLCENLLTTALLFSCVGRGWRRHHPATVAIGGPCGNAEELGLHIVSRENEHCRLLDSLGYVAISGAEVWV
jgi:hypothetical protein